MRQHLLASVINIHVIWYWFIMSCQFMIDCSKSIIILMLSIVVINNCYVFNFVALGIQKWLNYYRGCYYYFFLRFIINIHDISNSWHKIWNFRPQATMNDKYTPANNFKPKHSVVSHCRWVVVLVMSCVCVCAIWN